ncbi:diacylglycerol/lipid kinase family protein [Coprothermobacter platensis]|uniref:diacylglycerol/lipid kinase family protein n=1 Tax=Coprothermobacter platensis TaxID=108819 RepID=UPI00035E249B|nr:diacylglycerol kinase family protein [Coprothermobacter platensis]
MTKTIGIVLNPTAGSGNAGRIFPDILTQLSDAGLKTLVEITQYAGHGLELAQKLVKRGVDAIVSAGGDGTINEVLNGLAELDFAVPMGALGIGTGNDFLKTAGISKDIKRQIDVIKHGHTKYVDLMKIDYSSFEGERALKYSINDFGVGFPAKVSFRVNNMKGILKGTWSYLEAVVAEIMQNKLMALHIETPELSTSGMYNMLFAMVGKYLGGGIKIAPMAIADDGYMDVLFVEKLTRLEMLKLLPKTFKGTHLPHPKATHIRTTQLNVEGSQQLIYVQGEVIGFTPAHISLIPHKVPFLWPEPTLPA